MPREPQPLQDSPVRVAVQSRSNGRLRRAAEAFASQFPEVAFVAPTAIQSNLAHSRSLGVHRLSFQQLAHELARPKMAELGLAPLSSLGLEAVTARVVFQARQDDELKYFHPVANLPGFARALAKTLRDLRLAGTMPDRLTDAGAPGADLSILLSRYEEELATQRVADHAEIFRLATEAASQAQHRWADLPIVFLDVDLQSTAHRRLFAALANRAPIVFAAINGQDSLVEISLGIRAQDLDAEPAAQASVLARLRRNLFQPLSKSIDEDKPADDESFACFSAPGEGLEAVEIARRILNLARGGIAFDDIAVLLRNPDRYQPMVEDALRRANIPAYFSRGTTRPDPSGRAFLALLGCATENLSASRFAEYLSLGQLPRADASAAATNAQEWVAPGDELMAPSDVEPASTPEPPTVPALATPRGWERLLVDAAVIGGRDRWERRLNGLEAEWELHLAESKDAVEELEPLRERLERLRNLRSFALPLIGSLDALPKAAVWKTWLEDLSKLARQSLRDPEGVLALLADLAPMGDVGPATLEEVVEVLSDRLRFLRREPPQRRWGHVFVGSVDEARGTEFGTVFLPGLAEGLFPQRPLEDPLLLDEFREILNAQSSDDSSDAALSLRTDHVHEERLKLHVAIGAARDRLIASYPRMEVAEARPRVPSFYALELPRAIHGVIPELNQFERQTREAAPARLNWPAPPEPKQAIDDAEYDLASIARATAAERPGAARMLMEVNRHLARSLQARYRRWEMPRWQTSDGLITTSADTLAALAGHGLTARAWSPSSLEKYAQCPYKFALHGIYRLRDRDDTTPLEQLDPMTRGSLFHETQLRLFKRLESKDALPVTLDSLSSALAACEEALHEVAAEYAEKLAPAIERVWHSEIDDLRTDLRGWLHYVAHNEFDWTPRFFERDFGFDADLILEEGVKLHGRIDLIEQSASRGTWRVTDHKTGKRPEMIPRWVGGGKSLQPLLYSIATEKILPNETVEAGRLLYATQKGQYTPVEIKLDDRARQFLTRLMSNIDSGIRNGFLPPLPEKDACSYCDYRVVCGPYEERRTAKKDRRDERLETLFEIRGMA